MIKKLLSLFLQIDIFGKVPSFSIKSSSSFSTYIGSFLTLFIIIFITIYLLIQSLSLLKHQNVQAIETELSVDSPPKINFTDNNYVMAISLQYPNYTNFVDESVYVLKGQINTIMKMSDGSTKSISRELAFKKCNEHDFKIKKEYFELNDLQNLYCLETNEVNDVNLQGVFGKEVWTSFEFNFYRCNATLSNKTCKSEEELDKILNGGYMGLFELDYSFNPNNFSYPIQNFGENLFYSFNGNNYAEIWIYYREIEVITDNGFVFESKKAETGFKYDYMKTLNDYGDRHNEHFLRIIFGLSQTKNLYERKYSKLADLAADVGGMAKICFIIGECLTYFVNEALFKSYLLMFFYEKNCKIRTKIICNLSALNPLKKNCENYLKQQDFNNKNETVEKNDDKKQFKDDIHSLMKLNSKSNRNTNFSSPFVIHKIIKNKKKYDKNKKDNINIKIQDKDNNSNSFFRLDQQSIIVNRKNNMQRLSLIYNNYNDNNDNDNAFPKKEFAFKSSFYKYKLSYFNVICPLICFKRIRKALFITFKKYHQINYIFDIINYIKIHNDINNMKKIVYQNKKENIDDILCFKLPSLEEVKQFFNQRDGKTKF